MLNKLDTAFLCVKTTLEAWLKDFLTSEDGAVNIIEIVVLIGIVLIVVVLFKDKIMELVEKLFSDIGSNAEKVINN